MINSLPSFFYSACVHSAGCPEQPQPPSTKTLSKMTHLENVVSGVTLSTMSVFWYQERPGQNMQYLLHISSDSTVRMESGIIMGKSEVDISETSISTLTIHKVEKQDSATYYCAFWEVHSSIY